ncbi:hypothetical protein J8273_3984 [Carpediemonas membranifera]|uniref:Uncharacterized protein n=1 Tax=Carpediemonas membranifera TaxID=201153 RepID=A0A8J6B6Y5_9EUKA|nr:hypothetical protein J8273_3984 [Carpediemonas membranifera]|eukprot:KAG9394349.1 hypothetical protein J8273_3984 [Carpediemonas membranifera]
MALGKKAQQKSQSKSNKSTKTARKAHKTPIEIVQTFISNFLTNNDDITRANGWVVDFSQKFAAEVPKMKVASLKKDKLYGNLQSVEEISRKWQGGGDEDKRHRFKALLSLDAQTDELDTDDPLIATVREMDDAFHRIPIAYRAKVHAFAASSCGVTVDDVKLVLSKPCRDRDADIIFARPTRVLKKEAKTLSQLTSVIAKRNAERAEAESRDVLRRKVYQAIMNYYLECSAQEL